MQFDVTILGSNGAIPAYNRHPSAQIVSHNGNCFLIDCGEGTQLQMNQYGIKRGKLDNIFISHLHGDHYFGLIGLISSFNLNYRTNPLYIYGPVGLDEIINAHLKWGQTQLRYEIYFHPVLADKPRVIFDSDYLSVETIVLKHRLPTTGFLFKEKPGLRNMRREKIQEYHLEVDDIISIKQGNDFITNDGRIIPNTELTTEPRESRSYAYCCDTVYTEDFIHQIAGINMLYHDSTFSNEHLERAVETMHTTAKQCAQLAAKAGVRHLLLGHFSARYEDLNTLLAEALPQFGNTSLAIEGSVFQIE